MCEYIDISTNDDYNNIGIPTNADVSRSKPPLRPPLPKSPQPMHKVKHQAGVVDVSQIIRTSSSNSQPQIPERPSIPRRPKNLESKIETHCAISPDSSKQLNILQHNDAYQAPSAIYEEIRDDIPPKEPPPVLSQIPPVPQRNQQLPPIPARNKPPPLPVRANQH
ncbi:uncharacterized protein [Chironomus tepperi]|uniref:uncharacterized protein n=1 Tax=Chironomus tepperi TaxID=113505 RepID=UPI00391EF4F1